MPLPHESVIISNIFDDSNFWIFSGLISVDFSSIENLSHGPSSVDVEWFWMSSGWYVGSGPGEY